MSDDLKKHALEFVREHPTCMLSTIDNDRPVSRVMYCPRVDDDFSIWFATSISSNKVAQVRVNSNACVTFYHEGAVARFMGPAELVQDQAVKDELWEEDWVQYWKAGSSDPDLVLLKLTPVEADYFDMKKGEMGAKPLV